MNRLVSANVDEWHHVFDHFIRGTAGTRIRGFPASFLSLTSYFGSALLLQLLPGVSLPLTGHRFLPVNAARAAVESTENVKLSFKTGGTLAPLQVRVRTLPHDHLDGR
jgi:hypothetical protein